MPKTIINGLADSSRLTGFVCGRFLEVTETFENTYSGYGESKQITGGKKEKESPESIRTRAASRARRTVRRLCNTNELYYMYTLTFAVEHPTYFRGEKPFSLVEVETTKDRDKVISYWKAFARKMRRKCEKKANTFRYIAVIERHTGKKAEDDTVKKDCFHVHFVSDLHFPKRLIQHAWNHGLCNVSDWRKGRKKRDLDKTDSLPPVDNPGAYLSKYIGKDAEEAETNRKSYWASQNLLKPFRISGADVKALAKEGRQTYSHDRRIDIEGLGEKVLVSRSTTFFLPACAWEHSQEAKSRKEKSYQLLKKRKLRVANQNYKEYKDDERRKAIYRDRGKNGADRLIERLRILDEKAREASDLFEIHHDGVARIVSERRAGLKAKKRRVIIKVVGKARANDILQYARKSVTFRSR